MKTLTQRINIGEMRLLQEGEYLYRRCASIGFVYRIYLSEKNYFEISQASKYCYPMWYKTHNGKNDCYGGGYTTYATAKVLDAADDTEKAIEDLAQALKEIDDNPRHFFEYICSFGNDSNDELKAYEERCATLYDADGKFKRENIFNQKKYDELHQKLGIIIVSVW